MRVTKTEKNGVQIYKLYVSEGECIEVQIIDERTGKLIQTSVAYDNDAYSREDIERFVISRKELEKHGTGDIVRKCNTGAMYGDCARQS